MWVRIQLNHRVVGQSQPSFSLISIFSFMNNDNSSINILIDRRIKCKNMRLCLPCKNNSWMIVMLLVMIINVIHNHFLVAIVYLFYIVAIKKARIPLGGGVYVLC